MVYDYTLFFNNGEIADKVHKEYDSKYNGNEKILFIADKIHFNKGTEDFIINLVSEYYGSEDYWITKYFNKK